MPSRYPEAGRSADPGQEVDQGAALEAEGAADHRLAGTLYPAESIGDYLAAERHRQRHAAELQDRLGFHPFGTRPAADLAGWLLPHAIENDQLAHLAGLVVEECRRRRIVVPSPGALERLCVQARYQARGEIQHRLTDGLSAEPTSSAGRADAAPGGNQPELARLATPDAGSGEAGRDARSDRTTGPCPRSRP